MYSIMQTRSNYVRKSFFELLPLRVRSSSQRIYRNVSSIKNISHFSTVLPKYYPMIPSNTIWNTNTKLATIPRLNYDSCPIYNSISPILFDVSLRDGIQNADPSKWSTDRKKAMLRYISDTEHPTRMEVGSLVSSKVLPILGDSVEMYNHGIETLSENGVEVYMLVPSLSRLQTALNYNITNMSFITSVSNSFQRKNTKRTLEETKEELAKMNMLVKDMPAIRKKLYISCITECPISGKQDIDYVLREILMYHTEYKFDELCLSDTCGTLTFDDYEYLLDALIFFGVPASKISLHLHVPDNNIENIRRILWYSFDKHVNKFDVSMVETGGCSVTMSRDKLLPNLSYDLFHRILDRYIQYHLS